MAKTTALVKITECFKKPTFFKVVQGSTGAGKTFADVTLCIAYAESFPMKKVDIVGMSYPQLEGDAIAIFTRIMTEQSLWNCGVWNETKHRFTFWNGSKIQFLSVDKMGAHGPRRDLLYCPEANSMPWEVFDQLATRTRDKVLLDFNPTSKFWAHTKLVEKRADDTDFLILTYKDNEGLEPREIANIESHAPKPGEEPSNWWTVYGLGQIGSLEGNIYEGWIETTNDEIMKNGRLVRYGLDFGFGDETAMAAIYELPDNKIGVIEIVYQSGITSSGYPNLLKSQDIDSSVLIVADAARPEIITDIRKAGFRIIGANKNPGSVKRGIDRVKERQIHFCGKNLKKEYLSYAWRKKRDGETIWEPQDGNDHLMDALRYAVDDLKRPRFDF